jgi:hypothetical protein
MRKPYADRSSISGWMNFTEKDMEAMLRESLENDDQLLVHIVGDRTTEAFLNAMEATGGKNVWSKRRVRIEHGDGIMPDLVARVKELGVIVVQNPTHFALRELLVKRYGLERTEQLQPLRSLLEAGIPVAFGSDGPINPYRNIMLASSYPGKPGEALTREQAVTAYTLTAAYAEFSEKEKGSLEPGKLADLAVLSQDIFRVPRIVAAGIALVVAGCATANRPDGAQVVGGAAAASQVEAEIRELDQIQAKAWLHRDQAALERLWSPEFVLQAPSNQILTREGVFREMQTPRLAVGLASMERTVERVTQFGKIVDLDGGGPPRKQDWTDCGCCPDATIHQRLAPGGEYLAYDCSPCSPASARSRSASRFPQF